MSQVAAGRASPGPRHTPRGLAAASLAVLLVAYCLDVRFVVDPVLLYQAQQPAFFTGRAFLDQHLAYPGGPVEYAAAAVGQLYPEPWSGALALTAVALLLCAALHGILRHLTGGRWPLLAAVPAILLLALQQDYYHGAAPDLAVAVSAVAALAYVVGTAGLSPRLRLLVFAVGAVPVYCAVAGAWAAAVALVVASELARRRPALAGAVLIAGIVIPGVVAEGLYVLPASESFDRLLPLASRGGAGALGLGLYVWLPLSVAVAAAGQAWASRLRTLGAWLQPWAWVARLVVLGTLGAAAGLSGSADMRRTLRIGALAERGAWSGVLAEGRQLRSFAPATVLQIHRALAHSGQFLDNLFSYPLLSGEPILSIEAEHADRLDALSQVLLELGQVSQAEHLAHEELEIRGPGAAVLRRLVEVNLLKGRPQAARVFLEYLARSPRHSEWAARYAAQLNADPLGLSDPGLQQLRQVMPVVDHAGAVFPPELLLAELLARNPHNAMAFDYLVAHYLLSGQLDQVMGALARLSDFPEEYPSPRIPRHCQEAVLLFMTAGRLQLGKVPDVPLYGRQLDPAVVQRFAEFSAALARHRGDRDEARRALAPLFGNTFWYYYAFRTAAAGAPGAST